MSLTTTSRRMRRGLRNHPAPLDMTLLVVPGESNHRSRPTLVSAARPSIKESIAALGLNYSLSSGGVPPQRPLLLPQVPGSPFPGSADFVLDISSESSRCTTTAASITSLEPPLFTPPPNLTRLYTLSLPTSPTRQEPADTTTLSPPPSPPSDASSPVTPPLLTPAPARPARRWGMSVFPQDKVIRRVSSAPSSPISFDDAPISPTSIIAIKSPVERGDSKRLSDMYSLITPLTASPRDVPPVPPIPPAWIPPVPLIRPRIPPMPSSLPPVPPPKDPAPQVDAEISRSVSAISKMAPGKRSNMGGIKESNSQAKAERKEPRSLQVKTDPGPSFRGTNPYPKRAPSAYRRENSVRRPSRRLMLKRDSGAPFVRHTAVETESSQSSIQVEGTETKEARKSATRWSVSRRFLQTSTKRAKATVVMMRKGKEKTEEKDIVAVIPQLRELKVPRKLRF